MRVVLNRTTALRRRAGIGHYASQLEKTLRLQFAKGDDLLLFPGRWTARALGVFDCWKRPKNNDAGAGQGGPPLHQFGQHTQMTNHTV